MGNSDEFVVDSDQLIHFGGRLVNDAGDAREAFGRQQRGFDGATDGWPPATRAALQSVFDRWRGVSRNLPDDVEYHGYHMRNAGHAYHAQEDYNREQITQAVQVSPPTGHVGSTRLNLSLD